MDLLLEKNLVTFDQGKKDFVTGNSIVSYLLKAGNLTILELTDNPLREIKEKVEEIEERIQVYVSSLNSDQAKASGLIEQAIGQYKCKCNKNEVHSLLTLSIDAILNPQEKKILEKPQIEKIKTTREKRSNGCCNIL